MKFDKSFRVEAVVSTDVTRPHINQPWLDTKAAVLCATNGRAMTVFPVDVGASDRDGHIPVAAVRAARKAATGLMDFASLTVRKGLAVVGDVMFRRRNDCSPPPWKGVIPAYRHGDKGTVTIALSAKYLHELATAMGARYEMGVTLTFPAPKDDGSVEPIVVELDNGASEDARRPLSVLMPRRTDVPRHRANPAK